MKLTDRCANLHIYFKRWW